jgi:hypothetical protein
LKRCSISNREVFECAGELVGLDHIIFGTDYFIRGSNFMVRIRGFIDGTSQSQLAAEAAEIFGGTN